MNFLEYITPCQRSGMSQAEQIARQIEALIFDLGSEPGTPLGTKESLRHRFEVSIGTMNEAVRTLQVRGIIVMQRGSKGGVFVGAPPVQKPLRETKLGMERLKHNKESLIEQCQAVSTHLEPLVFVQATNAANLGAVAELQRLAQQISAVSDEPVESLRWSGLLYRRIAEMGFNTVLTAVYTTLVNLIEQEVGQAVAPVADHARPPQHVDVTASGDPPSAVPAAPLQVQKSVSDSNSAPHSGP